MNAVPRHGARRVALAAALLATGALAGGALAGAVTVSVHGSSGAPLEDAVLVFDPLDARPAASRDAAIIDQINKTFVPHVTVLRTGTAVTFPNSDQIRHQVYSFSPAKTFALKLYAGSPKTAVVFDKPGLVVLGCNIHDKMLAFVAVVDSPYFRKTAPSGLAVAELPPGRYRLRAWHADLGAPLPAQPFTVADAPLSLTVTMDVAHVHDPVGAWQ